MEKGTQRVEGAATAEFLMKLWLRFLCMKGAGAVACRGYASGPLFFPLPSNPLILAEGSIFFLLFWGHLLLFAPLGKEKFLCLPLALALKRQRKRTEQVFCAETLNEWGDPSGRDTKVMGLWSCTGEKLTHWTICDWEWKGKPNSFWSFVWMPFKTCVWALDMRLWSELQLGWGITVKFFIDHRV